MRMLEQNARTVEKKKRGKEASAGGTAPARVLFSDVDLDGNRKAKPKFDPIPSFV
jgi:hypothetical protein